MDAVRWHREEIELGDSPLGDYGEKGTLPVSQIDMPIRWLEGKNAENNDETFPFDANFFLKYVRDSAAPASTPLVPLELDRPPVRADALGRFLERRHWGDELVTDGFPPDRLLYYDRDLMDEIDDVSLVWDKQLEEALRLMND